MDYEQNFWIVTISADHAENGLNWGIVQACRGKSAPLRRMAAADGVVIYSPRSKFRDGQSLMSFTAIGQVTGDVPYQHEMAGGFVAWRRGVQCVQWQPAAKIQPIRPLLEALELTRDQPSWAWCFAMVWLPAAAQILR